jgi:hypothetical protein
MIYLRNGLKRLGVAVQPLWVQVVAPHYKEASDLPRLQDPVLGQATGAQDRESPAGGAAWLAWGCSLRCS